MTQQPFQFILASASPRRRELLAKAGFVFHVEPSHVDEDSYDKTGVTSEDHCQLLALAKARQVAGRFPDMPVLGSDTVVDFDGQIIGKPADAADAERITRMLFSKPHKVITGLALVWKNRAIEIVQADTTIVYPRKLTEQQIQEHIAGGLWEGKAGAYGIQETGDEFVDRIEGSFTNVMGLPMERVSRLLDQYGIAPIQTA
ncbi:Maf family protein [Anaerohalosphaeraceae bacterium U12dextr]